MTNAEEPLVAMKVLIGAAMTLSMTAGGLATWVVQEPIVVSRDALMPVGLVVIVLIASVGAALRASRYMDDRGRRLKHVEDAIYGTRDEHTGEVKPGLVDKVDRMVEWMEKERQE